MLINRQRELPVFFTLYLSAVCITFFFDPFHFLFLCRWLETLSRLRDEESEVMKNVPGWKPGTWYGEPIYFTLPQDKWWDPTDQEIYAQSRWTDKINHFWFNRMEGTSAPHWYDKYIPEIIKDWQKIA